MAGLTVVQVGAEPAQKDEQTTIDRYTGTAAAIVATALVQIDQLPGQPGRDSTRMFYRRGEPADAVHRLDSQPDPENWIRIDRLNKADLYRLTAGIPREDSLRRRAETKARYERQFAEYLAQNSQRENAEKEKRRTDAERELARMPASKEDFLRELKDKLSWDLEWALNWQSVKRESERFHGYMLTAGAVTEIVRAFTAVQEAISRADVVFDRTLHREVIAKRRRDAGLPDDNPERHLALVATTAKPRKRGGDVEPAGGLQMVWSAPQSDAGGGEV
jgi:hypothetical protein